QLYAALHRDLRAPLGHCLLHLDRAAHGIDDARKLHQHAVTGGLDDATVVLGDLRIDQFTTDRFQRGEIPFLVLAHQPRVARAIGSEDRREPTFDASWPCGLHRTSLLA